MITSTHRTVNSVLWIWQERILKTELMHIRQKRVVKKGDGWVSTGPWNMIDLALV